jgi:hypothetical protein
MIKKSTFLLLCIAPSTVQAFEDDANIFCGRLKGTQSTHAVTLSCGVNLSYGITEWFAMSGVYVNEGHPENHHRDGFAVQPGWYKDFGDWRVQFATGPYYSMDTTRRPDGTLLNDKHLGVLSSVALKWHPEGGKWYVGVGYNNVWMPNNLNSNSEVLFVGTDIGREVGNEGDRSDSKRSIGLWIGPGNNNNPGSKVKTAGQLEFPILFTEHGGYATSASIAGLYEGNTTLTDRMGVMAQAWAHLTFTKWTLSAGGGPYLERDELREERATNILAVVSLRATRQLTRKTTVGFNFNRVLSFYHKDADIFLVGIQREF